MRLAEVVVVALVCTCATARAEEAPRWRIDLELSRHRTPRVIQSASSPYDPLPNMSELELREREEFVLKAIQSNVRWTRAWHTFFIEFYAAGLLIQSGRAAVEDSASERADLSFSAAKAAVGVVGRMAHPPRAVFGARPVELYPGDSHAARARRLLAAERMLARDAHENDDKFKPTGHLVNLALNLAGALFVGIGYHDWTRGLTSAGIGFGVGEASIWLQPWGAKRDLRRYQQRFGAMALTF
jgi:hypothetical protein